MENPPKSFISRLFCSHQWEVIGNLQFYSSLEKRKAPLPVSEYKRWSCTKCGELRKLKII